jgi:hypothetical protein
MGLFSGIGRLWNNITGVTAANTAADAQRQGITNAQNMLSPYSNAGQNAIGAQSDLMGANGPEAQAAAVNQIQNNPMFQSMLQQGETSMLQNAAATGGLRGGNTQAALAQFAPQMLNQQIQQRFQNLGGIAGMGLAGTQQSAALAQDLGNVNASNAMANYDLQRGFIGDAAGFGMNIAMMAAGMPPMFGGGGGGGGATPTNLLGSGQAPRNPWMGPSVPTAPVGGTALTL